MENRKRTAGLLHHYLVAGLVGMIAPAALAELPTCTIDFDGACPNAGAVCGASFGGGGGCLVEGLANCYSTGLFSYKVQAASPLTITLDDDLTSLRLFFVHQGAGASGTMRFFDAAVGGNEVNAPGLVTNGDCLLSMPDPQEITFDAPVRRIEVTAANGALEAAWIDTFEVNFASGLPIPAMSEWGLLVMLGVTLTAGTLLFRSRQRTAHVACPDN